MKSIIYIIIACNFFIISCQDKTQLAETSLEKEYDSIRISNKYKISYGKRNDKYSFIQFEEDGQRKKYFGFYENGNLKTVEDFENDKIIRIEDYFNTPSNCLKGVSNFLYNKRMKNVIALSRINYDSCREANLANSVYTKLTGTKDTLAIREIVSVQCEAKFLEQKQKGKVLRRSKKFFEGGFDKEFNIVSKDSMKSINVIDDIFSFKVEGRKLGYNYYRGVLIEKVIYEDGSFQVNPNFIIYDFYVKQEPLLSPNNEKEYYLFFNKFF